MRFQAPHSIFRWTRFPGPETLPLRAVENLMLGVKSSDVQSTPELIGDAARKEGAEVLERMGSRAAGLTEDEAVARLAQYGPNQIARERRQSWLQRLYLAARNPLVILLTILAILSFATNDYKA